MWNCCTLWGLPWKLINRNCGFNCVSYASGPGFPVFAKHGIQVAHKIFLSPRMSTKLNQYHRKCRKYNLSAALIFDLHAAFLMLTPTFPVGERQELSFSRRACAGEALLPHAVYILIWRWSTTIKPRPVPRNQRLMEALRVLVPAARARANGPSSAPPSFQIMNNLYEKCVREGSRKSNAALSSTVCAFRFKGACGSAGKKMLSWENTWIRLRSDDIIRYRGTFDLITVMLLAVNTLACH